MTPPSQRRPDAGDPVDWGTPSRPSQTRPGAHSSTDTDWGSASGACPARGVRDGGRQASAAGPRSGASAGARGGARAAGGTDWGVGRGPAAPTPTPGQRARTPWPAAVRRRRLLGVAFALLGLVLATSSAMNLARSAEAGHPLVPPWLVVVLAGAGLVSAAGYLAWAGGTPVRGEAVRWEPTVLDAAAGLTVGEVQVADPHHLLDAAEQGLRQLPPGTSGRPTSASPRVEMSSGPTPLMGTSTVDQDASAPAGVAGAVGGFLLASAVVCAVLALVLPTLPWLGAAAALAIGGLMAVHLAGAWLGKL